MAENTAKNYLDQAGLTELVSQIKNRYDGSFKALEIVTGNDAGDKTGTYLKVTGINDISTYISAAPFVKDGMLESVQISTFANDVEVNGEMVPAGEKLIHFKWNTDAGIEESYLRASEIGKVYSAGDGVNLDGSTVSVVAGSGVTVDNNGVSVKAGDGVTVGAEGVSVKLTTNIKIDRTDDYAAFLTAAFGEEGIPADLTFEQFVTRIARIETAPSSIILSDTCSYEQSKPIATWPKLTLLTGYTAPAKNADNYTDVTNCILKSTFDTSTLAKSKSNDGYTGYVDSSFTFPDGSVNKPGSVSAKVSAKFDYGYQKDSDGDGAYDDGGAVIASDINTILLKTDNAFITNQGEVKLEGTWNNTSMGSTTWNGGTSIYVKPSTTSAKIVYGENAAKYTVSGNPYSTDSTNKKGVIPNLKLVAYNNLSNFLDTTSQKNIEVKNAYTASSGVSKDNFNKGSWNGNDYVFDQPTNTNTDLTTSQNYTGIYPIFMNIVPEGVSKNTISDSKPVINKSSLITNIANINLGDITYDAVNGTWGGSNSLLAIPNNYITTDLEGNTAIILGDSGKNDKFSTNDKNSPIPYLSKTGNNGNYKLLIAVPNDVTVKVSTPDTFKADIFLTQFTNAPVYTGITGTELKIGEKVYTVYNLSAKYNVDSWAYPQILIQLIKN